MGEARGGEAEKNWEGERNGEGERGGGGGEEGGGGVRSLAAPLDFSVLFLVAFVVFSLSFWLLVAGMAKFGAYLCTRPWGLLYL